MTLYSLIGKADILENITSFNGTQNQIVIRRPWNSEPPHNHSPCKLFNKAAKNTDNHAVRITKHAMLAKPPPAIQNSAVPISDLKSHFKSENLPLSALRK